MQSKKNINQRSTPSKVIRIFTQEDNLRSKETNPKSGNGIELRKRRDLGRWVNDPYPIFNSFSAESFELFVDLDIQVGWTK